jgi:SAM-dependent methyltransferase
MACVFRYDSPPEGETRFGLPGDYRREIWRCARCGHFVNAHAMDLRTLYGGAYVDATYRDGLAKAFERIMALPPERSDNAGRVERIVAELGPEGHLLDVGSGLGVFPARMKARGWRCTALDPDSRAVKHLRSHVGVDAVCAEFDATGELGVFDLVTFNRVLEHVADPVAMLARARRYLAPGGTVYVEVPDGELAQADGPGREEFFIEHICVFSMTSVSLVASQADFATRRLERLREPSGKYTIFGFLT